MKRSPQTQAKRARELAVKERRQRKLEKKQNAAAARAGTAPADGAVPAEGAPPWPE
jgi:hypothetical protein